MRSVRATNLRPPTLSRPLPAQMWQRSATVLVAVVVLAGAVSAAHDGITRGAVLPQGPGGEGRDIKQVSRMDSSIPSPFDRPWSSLVAGVRGGGPSVLKLPSHSRVVRDLRILYELCHEEGVFSMFHDCSFFYICFENIPGCGYKFLQILGACVEGYSFDKTEKDCVPKSCDSQVQNDPVYSPPTSALHDAVLPPAPVAQQLNTVPEWYSKQPALFNNPPVWYNIPPDWYFNPPTDGDAGTHKTQAKQVDQITEKHE